MNCKCKGNCCRKDGPKRKGCPCKTAQQLCGDSCSCGSKTSSCLNKSATNRPGSRSRVPAATSARASTSGTSSRASEMEECFMENEEAKKLIEEMEVEKLRSLAIKVLCRGVGSVEFIQSQLVEYHQTNYYGSPVRGSSYHQQPTPNEPDIRPPEVEDSTGIITHGPVNTPPASQQSTPMQSTPLMRPQPLPALVIPGSPLHIAHLHSTPLTVTDNRPDPPPPPPSHPVPDWCRCGHCRHMPREVERVCCKNRNCVAETSRFAKLCLDLDVLRMAVLDRAELRNDRYDASSRQFRKSAYRHFILDKHGYLGRGNRRVVPSCCVWKVRDKYPTASGIYMGFRES